MKNLIKINMIILTEKVIDNMKEIQEGDIIQISSLPFYKFYSVCYNWKDNNLILLPYYNKSLLKDSLFNSRQYQEVLDLSFLNSMNNVEMIKKGTLKYEEIELDYLHKESFIIEGLPVPFGTSDFFNIEIKFNDVFFDNMSPRTRTRRLSKIINQFKRGNKKLDYFYSRTNRLILL